MKAAGAPFSEITNLFFGFLISKIGWERKMTQTMDMTRGDPRRLMIRFSIPMLISSLFQQMYSMVDSAIVGRGISIRALAAIGSTGSLGYFIIGFLMGMTGGFAILYAQFFGAKNERGLCKAMAGTIRMGGLITAGIMTLSVIFIPQLLGLMNTPEDIWQDSYTYILITFLFMPAIMIYDVLASFLRSVGDSKTPLWAMVVSTLTNLALDLLFVLIFSWGVMGAAVATGIAQVVAAVHCFAGVRKTKLLKFKKEDWSFDRSIDLRLIKLGLPLAFQTSVTAIGAIVLQRLVNGLGSLYTAAYTAASRIMYFAEMPGSCLGIAMATYSGQNTGAGLLNRVKQGVREILPLSLGINLALGVLMCFFNTPLTAIFASPGELQEILPYSRQMMITQGTMKWVLGPLFIYRNALQGMGNTTAPMLSGFLELAVRIVVAYLLIGSLQFLGLCLADVSAWVGAEIYLMIVYYRTIKKMINGRYHAPVSHNTV